MFEKIVYRMIIYNLGLKEMDASQRYRALLSFVRAAQYGGFSAASRQMGISAAAVAKNVAGLEKALGVRLMNRSTRSLALTEEGRAFLGPVRDALATLDDAVDILAARRAEPAGQVRCTVGNSFGRVFMLPLLGDFARRFPSVHLEIDFDDRHVDPVREGYDFAIRGGRSTDSALVSRLIARFSTVLAASPDYLRKHGVPAGIADLDHHALVTTRFLSSGTSNWPIVGADGELHSFVPQGVLTLSDPESVTIAAVSGIGIAQIGTHHAWPYLTSGRLQLVLFDAHQPEEREFTLQYPHRVLLAPRVRATVDFLHEHLREEPALRVRRHELSAYAV